MKIKDKVRFSLVLITLIQAGVIYWLWNRTCPPCYEAGQTVITHDTIWRENKLEPIVVKVPEAFKTVAKKSLQPKATVSKKETVHTTLSPAASAAFSVSADGSGNRTGASASPCDSINYYSDTTINPMPDSCIIVVNDTIADNKITGRSIWYVRLDPIITTTITHVKKEKWKVYVGGAFTYNSLHQDRWGAGPSALLAIPKIGGVNYYFDAKNMSHTVGVMALIRFKK